MEFEIVQSCPGRAGCVMGFVQRLTTTTMMMMMPTTWMTSRTRWVRVQSLIQQEIDLTSQSFRRIAPVRLTVSSCAGPEMNVLRSPEDQLIDSPILPSVMVSWGNHNVCHHAVRIEQEGRGRAECGSDWNPRIYPFRETESTSWQTCCAKDWVWNYQSGSLLEQPIVVDVPIDHGIKESVEQGMSRKRMISMRSPLSPADPCGDTNTIQLRRYRRLQIHRRRLPQWHQWGLVWTRPSRRVRWDRSRYWSR